MKHDIPKWPRIGALGVLLLIVMAIFAGCASVKTAKEKEKAPSEPKQIIGIRTEEDSESVRVFVQGNRLLTYTSVKQIFPLSVVLYFPETALGKIKTPLTPEGDIVAAVTASELTEKGHTSRIEISLKKEVPYEVVRVGTGLKISFKKAPKVSGPKKIKPEKEDVISEAEPEKKSVKAPVPIKSAPAAPDSKRKEKIPAAKPKEPAWVNRIDFLSEDAGKSTIIIGTTEPVSYKIKKATDKRILLKLFDTNLPPYRQRPLITTRFESAVNRIVPAQTPAMKNTSIVAIELREPVPYYVEQQDNLLLIHFEASSIPPKPFEETKLPSWKKVFAEAAAETEVKEEVKEEIKGEVKEVKEDKEDKEDKEAEEKPSVPEKVQKFTGEKIALDFYDTDIKNVFRILMEVSGKNFAIDKDVSGRVSLTLDKPVPWDQVLELILRMNSLGMIPEGDIIRIATLNTLKSEEKLVEERYEARKKAKAKKLELEPLVSGYISINYANAQGDILPHLEKILTKDRGTLSVDARTNLIIMTDVAEKIELAKELVRRLDKVTPQVLIEARIVEASTRFSRSFGTVWGATGGIQGADAKAGVGPQRGYDNLGGTYGYNLAIDMPGSGAQILGFNFTRLSGTPFLLNAHLHAMETRGEGKIISSPKILTLNNKSATIEQGLEYPYQTVEEGEVSTEFKDITLKLSVTPQITADDRISIQVSIEKEDILSQTTEGPALTTKKAQTELLINDGDTIVIGGIIKSTSVDGISGLPGLSSIPLVGWLFKSKASEESKEELLIFITPTIVQLEQRSI